MMTLRSAAGRALRAFLIASAVVVGGALTHARADLAFTNVKFVNETNTYAIKYTTDSGSTWTNQTAGIFNWSNATGPAAAVTGASFQTYCIEINQFVNNGS